MHRLDAIRGVVRQTIGDLEALDPAQVLGREPSRWELDVETGSVRAARDTCCDELRDGCGLPMSPERSTPGADVEWNRHYSTALDGYRGAACRALEASLAALKLFPIAD